MNCRHCSSNLTHSLVDLGSAPPSNSYLSNLHTPEKWYPLNVLICSDCWLVQTKDYADREELFSSDYAYFSSTSSSWLRHSQMYAKEMTQRFHLDEKSLVGEIAANDGYLLQYFQEMNIPCFGVEPTKSTAKAARERGLTIFENFFSRAFAQELVTKQYSADLLAANNVLAHVPDINDFVSSFCILLKPHGVATFEFPHLYHLITESQFDTIYHEHFSYLSFSVIKRIFEHNGLSIFDVDELSTHGGSLRVFAQRTECGKHPVEARVQALLDFEEKLGMSHFNYYATFEKKITHIKQAFLSFLLSAQKNQEKVVGYGAAAKGNTLLNFSGVRSDLLSYVVDRSLSKQGKYLPGSRIPIVSEEALARDKPKWIVIFPWNIRDEIVEQLSYARDWGAQFVTAIPTFTIF